MGQDKCTSGILLLSLLSWVAAPAALAGPVTEYPSNGQSLRYITAGPDGALWFTDYVGLNGGAIGRMTTAGDVTEYQVPTDNAGPLGITVGPDGALWFTEYKTDQIGRVTTSGSFSEYALPPSPGNLPLKPWGITAGPDGALWATGSNAQGYEPIFRITTSGQITEPATLMNSQQLADITTGPDGALWFTECSAGNVTQMTTSGAYTEYPVGGDNNVSCPVGITTGPDGRLWFALQNGDAISQITTGGGVGTNYHVPTSGAEPEEITAGPDGALWFTELNAAKIGRITTSGAIREFAIPSGNDPYGIAVGPDGGIWFTEFNGFPPKSAVSRVPSS